jgi:predicted alpha/beta hydrolase
MQRIAPDDVGATAIGHFGFFRRRFEPTLWPRAGDWLERQASHH